jgi:hypothetical protein
MKLALYIRVKTEKGWQEWRTPALYFRDLYLLSDADGEKIEITVVDADDYAKAALPPSMLRPMKGVP